MIQACKILWINPKWPFPADDGAKQATVQLAGGIGKLALERGHEIHFLSLITQHTPQIQEFQKAKNSLNVKSLSVIQRQTSTLFEHLKNAIFTPFFPLTLAPYAAKKVTDQIEAKINEIEPDLVVFDGLHAGAGWFKIKSHLKKVPTFKLPMIIYRAHNVEADLWYRKANQEKNKLKKALLLAQGKKVQGFELALIHASKLTLCVSPEDAARFIELDSTTQPHLVSVPIGLSTDGVDIDKRPLQLDYLFVGKLDWAPNREGLAWLLKEAWPQALALNPSITLTIVGSGESAWLKDILAQDQSGSLGQSVRFKGRVDSVAPYYNDCVASIVPIFFGSGTRVKAIESSLFARACVSTAQGIEGLGLTAGKEYAQTETAQEWIHVLARSTPQELEALGRAAHRSIAPRFSPSLIAKQCLELLEKAVQI